MRPLNGLTVVTLEHAIAAPRSTRQLADLGARVIKIERPGVGDFARGYDQRVRGLASHFVWTNRSKESLTLDVKHPRAAALLTKLIVDSRTSWHAADVAMLAELNAPVVMLPKTESAADIEALRAACPGIAVLALVDIPVIERARRLVARAAR